MSYKKSYSNPLVMCTRHKYTSLMFLYIYNIINILKIYIKHTLYPRVKFYRKYKICNSVVCITTDIHCSVTHNSAYYKGQKI